MQCPAHSLFQSGAPAARIFQYARSAFDVHYTTPPLSPLTPLRPGGTQRPPICLGPHSGTNDALPVHGICHPSEQRPFACICEHSCMMARRILMHRASGGDGGGGRRTLTEMRLDSETPILGPVNAHAMRAGVRSFGRAFRGAVLRIDIDRPFRPVISLHEQAFR